jgi:hypothetical protein
VYLRGVEPPISSSSRAAQSFLDLSPEALNQGDQVLEPALVYHSLEPSDLSRQVGEISAKVLWKRLTLSVGLPKRFHRMMRAAGQLTNLLAELTGI